MYRLNVTTMLVPTANICKTNGIKTFQKAIVDFLEGQSSHCQTSIFPMTAEIILYTGEC